MDRIKISKSDFEGKLGSSKTSNSDDLLTFKNKIFAFEVNVYCTGSNIFFNNCLFEKNVRFGSSLDFMEEDKKIKGDLNDDYLVENNIFKGKVTFENSCKFNQKLSFENLIFLSKVRIHHSYLNSINFNNTVFEDLVDFWKTEFKKPIIFYKTDFNSTAVFSFVIFHENVLFTYSLLAGKTIFGKTNFKKGFDISQAVISGDLQLFNLKFIFDEYKNIYVGDNNMNFQNYISKGAIIPLVNKVHTFQILKTAFVDIGNYSDSILMQREEKRAFKELTNERLKNNKNNEVNPGDKFILWLNRWSNNYQSDFRNGIWFTLFVAGFFGFMTLIFTGAFQRNICFFDCTFNEHAFTKGINFIFNFLNPTRNITYLENLEPTFFGIAYLFDFLGRIAVGYGFYQTIQAFRKFK
jgi:hypothetical protein